MAIIKRVHRAITIGGLLGLTVFIFMYGIKCLNPFNMDWLMYGGDLKQHFMGWEFFRMSDWSFPFGVAGNLAFPFGMPITFTDSIPLLAIPAKLIANTFGIDFQYFGIWGLINYVLMGIFSAVLIRKWTNNIFFLSSSVLIFLLLPTFTMRVFAHTALSSQWLIIAAILMTIYHQQIKSIKTEIVLWSILLILAVCIHPYFFVMIVPILLASTVWFHKDWFQSFIKIVIPILSSLAVFWLIGGFYFQQVSAGGLGEFAFDPLSLILPMGWSYFIGGNNLNHISYESLSYMGMGLIFSTMFLLVIVITKFSLIKKYVIKFYNSHNRTKLILCFLIALGLIIFALGPSLKIGGKVLFEVNLPEAVHKIWATFRATARLFWPILYIFIILILVSLLKISKGKKKLANVLILLVLTLQVFDICLSGAFSNKIKYFNNTQINKYQSNLDYTLWNNAATGKKHMFYLDPIDSDTFFEISDFAYVNKMTINTGYFARAPGVKIESYQKEQIEKLLSRSADLSDTLYVTKNQSLAQSLEKAGYKTTVINRYIVIGQINNQPANKY